ncbi:MAG: hypothetical protein JO307_06890 [Bryobacterales bacterium]|nr:hypothetical protein [Bryobacterales bacterium]MBV9399873.1 hypothetical protein [Bryobacterales bacterium]
MRLWLTALVIVSAIAHAESYFVTVAGLGGEPDYQTRFDSEAADLDKIFKASGAGVHVYTLSGADANRAKLLATLQQVGAAAKAQDDFVLILIGHGSYDGVEYKFDLTGPDISGEQLAEACNRIAARRQLIVNTTSASGGSVAALERPGRALIAATKTGTEKNATVFARYWVEALQDPAADTDKNDSITASEAFQYADRKTADFYTSQQRLATEHPVFEDIGKGDPVRTASTENGEGRLLSQFILIRLGTSKTAALDPSKHELLAKKEELESQIDTLRYQKAAIPPADYKKQMNALLLSLATVQAQIDGETPK